MPRAIANLHDLDLQFDDNRPGAVFEIADGPRGGTFGGNPRLRRSVGPFNLFRHPLRERGGRGRPVVTGSLANESGRAKTAGGPRVNLLCQPLYARARARPWSARCYGVARQRDRSRQNSRGLGRASLRHFGLLAALARGCRRIWRGENANYGLLVSPARCGSTGSGRLRY